MEWMSIEHVCERENWGAESPLIRTDNINYSMIVLQKANVKDIGPVGQSKKFNLGLRR